MEFEVPETVTQLAGWSVAIGAILGVAVPAYKRGKIWHRRFKFVMAQEEIHARLDKKLDQLLHAVLHNDGSSLADGIDRIEANQELFIATHEAELHHDSTPRVKTDAQGNLTWANKAYVLMTGFPLESMMRAGWINSIHPDDRHRVETEWGKAVRQKREFSDDQHFIRPDGGDYYKRVECQPIVVKNELQGYVVQFLEMEWGE